jgi:Fur family zinc uptake transcriptional regulator
MTEPAALDIIPPPAPPPAPSGHAPEASALEDRLARAEQICARRGARLTDIRRNVLRLILESREPVGAYALLDALRARHGSGKPPTVYRALDFLLGQGLVHRVERLNAFVGCHDDAGHHHAAQFLICRVCGQVTEIEDSSAAAAILAAAGEMRFRAEKVVVEVEGVCGGCALKN